MTTLTMSDEGGVALLGKLGKKRGQGADGKDKPGTQTGGLKDSLGTEAKVLYQRKEGTSTIRENVIGFGTHPELVPELAPLFDELFPRNGKGEFKNDNPKLDFDTGGIGDVTDQYGTTRNLNYNVTQEETTGGGLHFGGLPLIEVKGGKLTDGRDLTGSSLEVIDVNGDKRKQDPSPKCKDKQVNPAAYTYDEGPPYADREPNYDD